MPSHSHLPGEITEAVAIASVTSVAEKPASLSNLGYSNALTNTNLSQQNAVAQQQALNEIQTSVLGKACNLITDLGPLGAMSAVNIFTGNAVAEEIADLKAATASLNQNVSGGGSGPSGGGAQGSGTQKQPYTAGRVYVKPKVGGPGVTTRVEGLSQEVDVTFKRDTAADELDINISEPLPPS